MRVHDQRQFQRDALSANVVVRGDWCSAWSPSSPSEGDHDPATGDEGHEPSGGFGHGSGCEGVADILKDAEFDGAEGADCRAAGNGVVHYLFIGSSKVGRIEVRDRATATPCAWCVERNESAEGGDGVRSSEVETTIPAGEVRVVGSVKEVGAVVDHGIAARVHYKVVKCRPVGLGIVASRVDERHKPERVQEFVRGHGFEVVVSCGNRVVGVPIVVKVPVDRAVRGRPVLINARLDFALHGGFIESGSGGNPTAG